MTWAEAYQEADKQLAYWHAIGLSVDEAMEALELSPSIIWQPVRQHLAAWAKLHAAYEMWE